MDKLMIEGNQKLEGEVHISRSKNASLPLLAATLLFRGPVALDDLPQLSDIHFFISILKSLGVEIQKDEKQNRYIFETKALKTHIADYDLVRKMRASVLVLGPMLSRFKKAQVSLPGGCAIGQRPVDIHLDALKKLGAHIHIENGYIHAHANELIGCKINFPFPSVGATENLIMACVYAQGVSILDNCAREPEIEDLCYFLEKMGVKIEGIGTSTLKIHGIALNEKPNKDLIVHRPIADRIEAATFVIAGLMTNSKIKVCDAEPAHLESFFDHLKKMNAVFEIYEDKTIELRPCLDQLKAKSLETAPYPGFPTDIQAQMMCLTSICKGSATISEHIFENRFMHVPELNRMGHQIELDGRSAFVQGECVLNAAPVMCTDLRASAALVLSALASEGKSEVLRIYHLDRGYENLCDKLFGLGAKIERIKA